MMRIFESILLVGCGNMAGAMLEGWLAGGLDPARFTVVEPSDRALPEGIVRHRAVPETGQFDPGEQREDGRARIRQPRQARSDIAEHLRFHA